MFSVQVFTVAVSVVGVYCKLSSVLAVVFIGVVVHRFCARDNHYAVVLRWCHQLPEGSSPLIPPIVFH